MNQFVLITSESSVSKAIISLVIAIGGHSRSRCSTTLGETSSQKITTSLKQRSTVIRKLSNTYVKRLFTHVIRIVSWLSMLPCVSNPKVLKDKKSPLRKRNGLFRDYAICRSLRMINSAAKANSFAFSRLGSIRLSLSSL